jgi:hypothetical protein
LVGRTTPTENPSVVEGVGVVSVVGPQAVSVKLAISTRLIMNISFFIFLFLLDSG